jgi:lycopene cyclase domain-containing protein
VGSAEVLSKCPVESILMKYTYLWVDFFTIIIPFLFSFHPRLNFYKNFKWFFPANLMAGIVFVAWDVLFTKMGVWGFNPKYLSGIYFFNLPIEEILFFICIPFACVFTYHCLTLFYKFEWTRKAENIVMIGLSALLLLTGLLAYPRAYTATTFISLGILLLAVKFILKIKWFSKLASVYLVLLIPFFIVNGILTGTGLDEPVVWYNDAENLSIRLLTIPIEDIFYGFELILLNMIFYTYFMEKFGRKALVS